MSAPKDRRKRTEFSHGERRHSYIILDRAPNIIEPSGRTLTAWHCRCDCGTEFIASTKHISKNKRPLKTCGCVSGRFRAFPDDIAVRNLIADRYESKAVEREIPFHLSNEEVGNLIFKNCTYCGSPPSNMTKRHGRTMATNGIDRVDSNGSYEISNCVPCCFRCNRAKGSLTTEQFQAWIERAIKHHQPDS